MFHPRIVRVVFYMHFHGPGRDVQNALLFFFSSGTINTWNSISWFYVLSLSFRPSWVFSHFRIFFLLVSHFQVLPSSSLLLLFFWPYLQSAASDMLSRLAGLPALARVVLVVGENPKPICVHALGSCFRLIAEILPPTAVGSTHGRALERRSILMLLKRSVPRMCGLALSLVGGRRSVPGTDRPFDPKKRLLLLLVFFVEWNRGLREGTRGFPRRAGAVSATLYAYSLSLSPS